MISLTQLLEPFIEHHGAFRWAALLTLASFVENLPDLQFLRLLDCDMAYMEKYLTLFSERDQPSVMRKFQSFLMLTDNRDIMNEKGLLRHLSSVIAVEENLQKKDFLSSLIQVYQSVYLRCDDERSLMESTIVQCRSALAENKFSHELLKSAELVIIQYKKKCIDAEENPGPVILSQLLLFIGEYFSGWLCN